MFVKAEPMNFSVGVTVFGHQSHQKSIFFASMKQLHLCEYLLKKGPSCALQGCFCGLMMVGHCPHVSMYNGVRPLQVEER